MRFFVKSIMDAEKSEKEVEAPPDKLEDPAHHLPRPLNIEEKKYLLAVERGDLPNVKRFLQIATKGHVNGISVDVNCVDSLGRGALTLAIESENLQMVELLIVMGVDTKDALLHAIDQEFVEAVELLLEHEELMMTNEINSIESDKDVTHSWQRIDPALARFSSEMTPLMLAAQRNNYEILKLLLDRGATLPMPHDIRCGCEDCLKSATEDPLKFSSTRISEYKALSSPCLIALSSPDPLLTAFQLSWELRELASAEPESKSEYMKLRQQVEKFAVDLLQQIRNTSELNTILNYDPQVSEDPPTKPLARLEQAIQYKQKRFVAHSNVQQLLAAIWYEGVPGFRRKSASRKACIVIKTALLFPFYCLIYFLAPESKTGRLMRRPFMKFLVHAASYVFFLFVLILVSQRAEVEVVKLFGSEESRRNVENDLARQRGAGPSPLESIVVIYVLGFIWQETREVYVDGLKAYLRDMWNFIDFTRNTLYVATGILRIAAYLQQKAEIQMDSSAAMIPRENWPDFDPQLIAEGLFAAANIFSALKLVHLFSINPHLGPLQISLGKMVIDIVKFFFIYTLVLFSFACGLNQLLWYFAELEKRKCYSDISNPSWDAASDACIRWRRFSSLFESCQSLFWASFGGIGIDSFELSGIKSYTRFWGLLMFGSYSVINVIVLLNLLIAMMSNSYAVIEEDADTEWKFARSKLWMSFFEEGGTLPPPFNIFPSPKRFLRMCGIQKKSDNERNCTLRRAREHKYETVMCALIWRYVVNAHSEQVMEPVTEDDVHELKSDLSSWRCELLDILQRNGMDISGIDAKEKTVLGKKMKMWERRLMKDFQVAGSFDMGNDQTQDTLELQTIEGEDNVTRWRRIAKMAVLQSAGRRWGQVVSSAVKSSQIGKGNSKASLQSQKSLKRAMEEARRLSTKSPLPSICPIELPESTAATILHVLKDIVEDHKSRDHSRIYRGPPKLCVTPDPTSPIIHPEPATAVGYIDEVNRNSQPALPPYTSPKKPRRRDPKSPGPNHPKTNYTSASDLRNSRSQLSPNRSHTLHVPTSDSLSNSSASPSKMQNGTHQREMNMSETGSNRLKPRASISPRRIAPSSDLKCQKGNDKQKLLNITPKSPRYSNSKSPKRGGWL